MCERKKKLAVNRVYRSVRARTGCPDARRYLATRAGCSEAYVSRMLHGEDGTRRGERWLMLSIVLTAEELAAVCGAEKDAAKERVA